MSRLEASAVPDLEAVSVGDPIPAVTLSIDFSRVVIGASATRDFFPGHHNPDYARAQGLPTIYLNTMFLHGFVDRTVTDWAGPTSLITRRTLRIVRPTFAGEIATCSGHVAGKERRTDDTWRIALDMQVRVGESVRCTSTVTVLCNTDGTAPAPDPARD